MAHGFERWLGKVSAPVHKQEEGSARENSFGAVHELKDYFDGELDLPLRNRRSYQGTRSRTGQGCSVRCKNVGVAVTRAWRSEVRVIENVEHFSAELHVEILRDFFDAVVLENREVQTGYARANQAIAAGIAPKLEPFQETGINRPCAPMSLLLPL